MDDRFAERTMAPIRAAIDAKRTELVELYRLEQKLAHTVEELTGTPVGRRLTLVTRRAFPSFDPATIAAALLSHTCRCAPGHGCYACAPNAADTAPPAPSPVVTSDSDAATRDPAPTTHSPEYVGAEALGPRRECVTERTFDLGDALARGDVNESATAAALRSP